MPLATTDHQTRLYRKVGHHATRDEALTPACPNEGNRVMVTRTTCGGGFVAFPEVVCEVCGIEPMWDKYEDEHGCTWPCFQPVALIEGAPNG